MTTLKRILEPPAYYAVMGLLGALLVVIGLWTVTRVHGANREKREACRIAAEALVTRRPFLRHTMQPPDACDYLRRLKGDDA